jgi:hypothetical protein
MRFIASPGNAGGVKWFSIEDKSDVREVLSIFDYGAGEPGEIVKTR